MFDEFLTWCDGEATCVLYERDVRALFADLFGQASRGEIPYPIQRSVPLRPEELVGFATAAASGGPERWPVLAETLLALETRTTVPLPPDPGPESPDVVAYPYRAVVCADWSLPLHDYAELTRHVRRTTRLAPDLHYSQASFVFIGRCLREPTRINNPQHRLHVRGTPPILLVNGLHDPSTGYNGATHVAAQLGPAARLLTYDGWGRGVYPRSTCAADAIDTHLITATLPAPNTHCSAD